MEVYLVRHTTPDIEKGVCYGQADLDLIEGFESEIDRTIQQLPEELNIVYSSPLKRCKILAETIHSGKVKYDKNLMEYDFGSWERLKWDNIPKSELDPWMKDYVNISVPNGESLQMMSDRVTGFWNTLKQEDFNKIAIVTHSGVIRIIKSIQEGTPLKDCFSYKMEYGAVFKISL